MSRFPDFLVKFSLVFDVRIKNRYRWAIKSWERAFLGHENINSFLGFPGHRADSKSGYS
jgi:hypothetical protein